jgi:thioredoxin-related protein
MKLFWILWLLLPLFGYAQETGAVHFEQGLNWKQIKKKAEAENKYIFVDCYATWCGPCKMMDNNIYPLTQIGNEVNSHFISVKVQFDTARYDNNETKGWYKQAHDFRNQYKVTALPTFLFFSPKGIPIHKGIGYMGTTAFTKLIEDALNPETQYYTLLTAYQRGEMNNSGMLALAKAAKSCGENQIASKIINDYIANYLLKLNENSLFTKNNLTIINSFRDFLTTDDPGFRFIYQNPHRIDSVMERKNYSKAFIGSVITRQLITPAVVEADRQGITPDWVGIEKTIANQFGSRYAEMNILNAKQLWFFYHKQWKNYAEAGIPIVDQEGIDSLPPMTLNNDAWLLFLYSDDKNALTKALLWMKRALELDSINKYPLPQTKAGFLDTYAQLLYKLGQKSQAIVLEERVVALSSDEEQRERKKKGDYSNSFVETLRKMKIGEITWHQNN